MADLKLPQPEAAAEAVPALDFNAIYLETNVLIESNWPNPFVPLSEVLGLATRVGVPVFLPEPVEREAEQHWIRTVNDAAKEIKSGTDAYNRLTRAVNGRAAFTVDSRDDLRNRYREGTKKMKEMFKLIPIPLTSRPLSDMFDLATRYVPPFQPGTSNNRGQGKGFQDAVILSTILEHMQANKLSGLVLSRDTDFAQLALDKFMPACKDCKIVFADVKAAFDKLFGHFWDRNVKAPWEEEMRNAKQAAIDKIEELKQFVLSHLEFSMLIGLTEPLELRGLEGLNVDYVHTPVPDPNNPNRKVSFAVAVNASVKVLVKSVWESWFRQSSGGPQETVAAWFGGVEATADVVDQQYTNIQFKSLLPASEMGSGKYLKRSG